MNFFKPKDLRAAVAGPPSLPQRFLHQAFTSLQTHFYDFFQNMQRKPPLKSTFYARILNENNPFYSNSAAKNCAMSAQTIEERLDGVPVYALSSGSQELILLSGTNTGKELGLFCFSEADAETLLKQMKSVDPSMSSDSQVVALALSKVLQLKVDGVALRLMPEASQIRNALKEKKMADIPDESFIGVPVFQCSIIKIYPLRRYSLNVNELKSLDQVSVCIPMGSISLVTAAKSGGEANRFLLSAEASNRVLGNRKASKREGS
ncbi:hypothetical protein OROGR_008566 [Orobanche gracilis]